MQIGFEHDVQAQSRRKLQKRKKKRERESESEKNDYNKHARLKILFIKDVVLYATVRKKHLR